jgi:hypothetical protein|tara:strand:- start:220 stop:630 length:411 start_codon:yes stop_codon:yes gene_type:complete
MAKKIFILVDEIKLFLTNYKVLRDSDERLMANIWAKFLGREEIKILTATDILHLLAKGDLPSYESISRCRRKLQQEFPRLRGDKWEKRQLIIQNQVKKELKSFPKIRKQLEKAKMKRMEIKTPYPVGFEYKRSNND